MIDTTDDMEVPDDLRHELRAAAIKLGCSYAWLIGIYRRGFSAKLGETGRYPYGPLDRHDEGELAVAIAADPKNGVIRFEFGKPVAWLALPATHARQLSKLLAAKADELEKRLS